MKGKNITILSGDMKHLIDTVRNIILTIILAITANVCLNSQDISLISLNNPLRETLINPAAELTKTWNISLANTQVEMGTDGPTINQLTAENSEAKRYIHPSQWQGKINPENLVFANLQLNTLDFGVKVKDWGFLLGHAFRTNGTVSYTEDLVKLIGNGNGPYVNQTLQIGPALDYISYNELYLGVQKKFNRFTVGIKTKLLFGVSAVRTEESSLLYKTSDDFYQWEFNINYNIRSSSALRFKDISDVEFNPSGITFENLFYNNTGIAFDLGVNMQLSKNFNIFWSALDLGSIKWDLLPRNHVSQGKFTFEGIDPITYISDTTGFNFTDSLVQFIPFTTYNETFTTPLQNRFYLGAKYQYKDTWTFQGLVRFNRSFIKSNAQLAVSAVRHWKWFQAGLSLMYSNGTSFHAGAMLQGKIGPVAAFVATDNMFGFFAPFDQRLVNARGGLSVSF